MFLLADTAPEVALGFFERINPMTLGLIVAFFLAVNGFFVAMEFALVAARKTKIDEMAREGRRGALSVQRGKKHVDDFVGAGQLGITVASLILGAAGEALFRLPLHEMGLSSPVALTVLSLAMMTVLHVVVGEQVPKMVAIYDPPRVATWTVPMGEAFLKVFRPAIWLLGKLTDAILKLFGFKAPSGGHSQDGSVYSEEEIQALLGLRESAGLAEQGESEMIARVFSFFDMTATQVMVPRTEMCCIESTATVKELVALAAQVHHERYPIYGKDLDDIKGVVILKDLIEAMNKEPHFSAPVSSLIREALCLPGSLSVSNLMKQMQRHRTRVAILLDEFGGTAGMVTYGDLLERIVGEEVEEKANSVSEPEPDDIEKISEREYRVSGLVLIEDFEGYFGVEIVDEHNDTVGGAVFSQLGRRPQAGDEVELAALGFRVESLDGLRIDRLIVTRPEPAGMAQAEESAV